MPVRRSPHRVPSRARRALAAVALAAVGLGAGPVGAAPAPSTVVAPQPGPSGFSGDVLAEARRSAALAKASVADAMAKLPAEDGLLVDGTTSYVFGDDGVVHVTYDGTVKNDSAPSYGYYSTITSYLPDFGIPVLKEAVNVAASSGGTAMPVRMETGNDVVSLAVADLQPDLYYPQSRALHITYDLPPTAARTSGLLRLNEAFAGFPLIVVGDPGKASISITLPKRYEVEVVGADLQRRSAKGQVTYSADGLSEEDFGAAIVARDDDALAVRDVDLPGRHEARVLAWPGDQEWSDFVADHVDRGVPVLADLIGLDWPADRRLDLVETIAPYIYGYAGWYTQAKSTIEIGDALDAQVVLHEVSHVWFNDDLFDERWIDEGLADEYAAQAMQRLGETPPAPDPIDPAQPGHVTLSDWSDPTANLAPTDDQEQYGYNASWSVLHQIAGEIGIDHLSDALQAAHEPVLTYAAPGHSRALHDDLGWKELLDLLQAEGSQQAEPLFRTYVANASEQALFDQRAATRARYDQLVADGHGWVPPVPVRQAMTTWSFDRAGQLMDQLAPIAAKRDRLLGELAAHHLPVPDALRTAWETSESLVRLDQALDQDLAAVRAWAATDHRVDTRGTLSLTAIGTAFGRLPSRVDQARDQLAEGRFTAAAATVDGVDRRLDEGTTSGIARLVALAALALAVTLYRRSGVHLRPEHVAVAKRTARAAGRGLLWRHTPEP